MNFEPIGPSKKVLGDFMESHCSVGGLEEIEGGDAVEELGFGVYKAGEFGEFEQVGFGQPISSEGFGSFKDSGFDNDRHSGGDFGMFSDNCLEDSHGFKSYQECEEPAGWGHRFARPRGFDSYRGGFGSFPGYCDLRDSWGHQRPIAWGFGRGDFRPPRPAFVIGGGGGGFKVPRGFPSGRASRSRGRGYKKRGVARGSVGVICWSRRLACATRGAMRKRSWLLLTHNIFFLLCISFQPLLGVPDFDPTIH